MPYCDHFSVSEKPSPFHFLSVNLIDVFSGGMGDQLHIGKKNKNEKKKERKISPTAAIQDNYFYVRDKNLCLNDGSCNFFSQNIRQKYLFTFMILNN